MKKIILCLIAIFLISNNSISRKNYTDKSNSNVIHKIRTWPGKDEESGLSGVKAIPIQNYISCDIHKPRIAHTINGKNYKGYDQLRKYMRVKGDIDPHKKEYFKYEVESYSIIDVTFHFDSVEKTGARILSESSKVLSELNSQYLGYSRFIEEKVNYGIYYAEFFNDSENKVTYEATFSYKEQTIEEENITLNNDYKNKYKAVIVENGYIPGGLKANQDFETLELSNYVDYSNVDPFMETPYKLESCSKWYKGWISTLYIWDQETIDILIATYETLKTISRAKYEEFVLDSKLECSEEENSNDLTVKIAKKIKDEIIKSVIKILISDHKITTTVKILTSFIGTCLTCIYDASLFNSYKVFIKQIDSMLSVLKNTNGRTLELTQYCSVEATISNNSMLGGCHLEINPHDQKYITSDITISNINYCEIKNQNRKIKSQIQPISSPLSLADYIGISIEDFLRS